MMFLSAWVAAIGALMVAQGSWRIYFGVMALYGAIAGLIAAKPDPPESK
jgi:hypothetical protein